MRYRVVTQHLVCDTENGNVFDRETSRIGPVLCGRGWLGTLEKGPWHGTKLSMDVLDEWASLLAWDRGESVLIEDVSTKE
jgi:hypothetical protein